MALFELTELASFLQTDLDTASADLARELATGLVESETGKLEATTSTFDVPIRLGSGLPELELPSPAVGSVDSIVVDGTALDPDDWQLHPGGWVELFELPSTTDARTPTTATVTASIGCAVVPAVAKAVALSVAARIYDNSRGLRSETIDGYTYTRAGADDALAGVTLFETERVALSSLRPTAYVTGTRP